MTWLKNCFQNQFWTLGSTKTKKKLHFHFHSFSGWVTSRGQKLNLKEVFNQVLYYYNSKFFFSVLFSINGASKYKLPIVFSKSGLTNTVGSFFLAKKKKVLVIACQKLKSKKCPITPCPQETAVNYKLLHTNPPPPPHWCPSCKARPGHLKIP